MIFMSYLNISVLNKETGVEKKASIPQKIAAFYIEFTASLLGQKPNNFSNSETDLSKADLYETFYNLIMVSKRNIKLYLGEIGMDFLL